MAILSTQYAKTTGEQIALIGGWQPVPNSTTGNLTTGVPYLCIFSAEIGQDSQSLMGVRATRGGNVIAGSEQKLETDNSPESHATYFFPYIYTPSVDEALGLEGENWTSSLTGTWNRVHVIAIPLAHVVENTEYYIETDFTLTDISNASPHDHSSLTFTPAVTGHDWLVLGNVVVLTDNANDIDYHANIEWSGGVTSADDAHQNEEGKFALVELRPFNYIAVRNLTNVSHTVKWTVDLNAAGTGGEEIQYSCLYAIDLTATFEKFAFEYNAGADIVNLSQTAFATEVVTCGLTPDTAADVLVLGMFVWDNNYGTTENLGRLQVDGVDLTAGTTTNEQYMHESWATQSKTPFTLVGIDESATAAAHTYDLDASQKDGATGGADDTCIVAISLVSIDTGVGPTAGGNPELSDAPTEAAVPLTFTDSVDNDGCYLHRSDSQGFTPTVGTRLTADLGASAASYTDTAVNIETLYYYVVEWTDTTGSVYSSELTVLTAPAKPVTITLDTVTSTRIDFTITPGTLASDNLHKVFVKENGVVVNTIFLSIGVLTSFVDGLNPGSTYTFEAQSYFLSENGGIGAYSTLLTSTPETAPSVPIPPTNIFVSDTTIILGVTAATGADSHYIHAVAGGSPNPTDNTTRSSPDLGATPTGYTENNATPDTVYDIYVEAVNTGGSTFSTASLLVTTAPARPTGISVTAASESQLTVQIVIASGSNDNQHKILYRLNGSLNGYQTLTLTAGQNTGTLTGLSNATTYEITAIAFGDDGFGNNLESGQIASITGTTTEGTQPIPSDPTTQPLIAGDLITVAKQMSYPHVGPVMVSDAALLAFLGNLEDKVVMQIFQQAPQILEVSAESITCVASTNGLGYATVQALGYGEFTLTKASDSTQYPIKLVPTMDAVGAGDHPSAVIISRVIYPNDPLDMAWEGTAERDYFKDDDTIDYRYIPMPSTLRTMSSTLLSPAFARPYLVSALTTQALLMNPQTSQTMLQGAVQREMLLWEQLLMQIYKFQRIQSQVG